jgi:hypothetical protein
MFYQVRDPGLPPFLMKSLHDLQGIFSQKANFRSESAL